MKTQHDPSDESLRALLREMEREREKHAPPFQRVWQHARRTVTAGTVSARPLWGRPQIAALAATLILAAAVFWWSRPATDVPAWAAQLAAFEDELESLPALPTGPEPATWDLPTDFLLARTDDENSNRIRR